MKLASIIPRCQGGRRSQLDVRASARGCRPEKLSVGEQEALSNAIEKYASLSYDEIKENRRTFEAPPVKTAIERVQSHARMSYAEREQFRASLKGLA